MDSRIYNGSCLSRVISFIDDGYGNRGVVVSVNGTHPCAYVQVAYPERIGLLEDGDDHVLESVDSYLDVHGGVTFIGSLEKYGLAGTWIGWDYAHYGDYVHMEGNFHTGGGVTEDAGHAWTLEEIEKEVKEVINQYWKKY